MAKNINVAHNNTEHSVEVLSSAGIHVGRVLRSFHGILTGVSTYVADSPSQPAVMAPD